VDDVIHNLTGPVSRSPLSRRTMAWVQTGHAYLLRGNDRFANRAGNTCAVFAGRVDRLEDFRDAVLRPYGTQYQLRVAVYDDDQRFAGFVGFLRPARYGEFRAAEVRLLDTLAPRIADGFATMRLIGSRRTATAELIRGLDLFDEPAFVVTWHGAVVHANAAAVVGYARLPGWLAEVPRFEATPQPLARTAQLELDGRALWLVVPRRSPRRQPNHAARRVASLPPSLRRIAELLLAGLADKEIAARTELSLPTVRTYVARLYRRLGVHSRPELLALFGGTRDSGVEPLPDPPAEAGSGSS